MVQCLFQPASPVLGAKTCERVTPDSKVALGLGVRGCVDWGVEGVEGYGTGAGAAKLTQSVAVVVDCWIVDSNGDSEWAMASDQDSALDRWMSSRTSTRTSTSGGLTR
jgi:hypothetical protein